MSLLHIKFSKSYAILYLIPILGIYLLVAYNSVGFHHYDEHFQIVEFANYKMGWIDGQKLTWEFREKVRPGFQPLICYGVFKICELFHETDGYNLTLILRIITALFFIATMSFLINSYKPDISTKLFPYFFIISYLLWFLPYIGVRFSSETWSGNFLLLTLARLRADMDRGKQRQYFLMGILLGISALLRYQSGLFIVGITLWFIFVDKVNIKAIIKFYIAILLVLAIGFLIDRWLYGTYTFTFYNYFNVNIVKNVASKYGTLPWYWIMVYILSSPGPLGVLIFASFFILLILDSKNPLLWTIAPFLVVHSIIPHKELRFLFPVAGLCPLFIILGFEHIKTKIKLHYVYVPFILLVFFAICNIAGLIAIAFTGASNQVAVDDFIHREYKNSPLSLVLSNVNPYIQGPPLNNTFYDGRGIDRHVIITFWKEDLFKFKKRDTTVLLIIPEDDFTGPKTAELFQKYGLVKVYQNIPSIVEMIYRWYDKSLNNASIWVYQFK